MNFNVSQLGLILPILSILIQPKRQSPAFMYLLLLYLKSYLSVVDPIVYSIKSIIARVFRSFNIRLLCMLTSTTNDLFHIPLEIQVWKS